MELERVMKVRYLFLYLKFKLESERVGPYTPTIALEMEEETLIRSFVAELFAVGTRYFEDWTDENFKAGWNYEGLFYCDNF